MPLDGYKREIQILLYFGARVLSKTLNISMTSPPSILKTLNVRVLANKPFVEHISELSCFSCDECSIRNYEMFEWTNFTALKA